MEVFNPNSNEKKKNNKCPDVYPCILTNNTYNMCMQGCNSNVYSNGYESRNCNDCLWICFPLTVVIDIITTVPFACMYGVNKKC